MALSLVSWSREACPHCQRLPKGPVRFPPPSHPNHPWGSYSISCSQSQPVSYPPHPTNPQQVLFPCNAPAQDLNPLSLVA